jgi:hypothetical protein
MDGSDELDLAEVNIPRKFLCIGCAGVVLAAGHICATSGRGMTEECINAIMGKGDCNGCLDQFFTDLEKE